MIPYFSQPVLDLGPFQIHAFGILAAAGVVLGGRIIMVRAHRSGIPVEHMFRFCFWVYVFAIAGAVLSKPILDDFPAFLAHPSQIFYLTMGVRSAGGITAGFLAGLVLCRYHRLSLFESMRRLELVAYAMPFGWMLGRLGCSLAHDHRGYFTTSWIAVRFPEGPRYDLGFIEFLFLIGMSALFWYLGRHPRPVGFFLGLYGVVYGAFRIWLDTLHLQPMRFYGGMLAVVIGLLAWLAMGSFQRTRPAPIPARAVAAG